MLSPVAWRRLRMVVARGHDALGHSRPVLRSFVIAPASVDSYPLSGCHRGDSIRGETVSPHDGGLSRWLSKRLDLLALTQAIQ